MIVVPIPTSLLAAKLPKLGGLPPRKLGLLSLEPRLFTLLIPHIASFLSVNTRPISPVLIEITITLFLCECNLSLLETGQLPLEVCALSF
jgi:hypothetical protein